MSTNKEGISYLKNNRSNNEAESLHKTSVLEFQVFKKTFKMDFFKK